MRYPDDEIPDLAPAKLTVDVGRYRRTAPVGRQAARGGVNGPKTEVLAATARMLGLDVPRVAGLVGRWPTAAVADLLEICRKTGKKPAALWWFRYKDLRKQFAKQAKDRQEQGKEAGQEAVPRRLRGVGQGRREGERGQGQLALLGDREEGGGVQVGEGQKD